MLPYWLLLNHAKNLERNLALCLLLCVLVSHRLLLRCQEHKPQLLCGCVLNDHGSLVQTDIDELYELVKLFDFDHFDLAFSYFDYSAEFFVFYNCPLLKFFFFLFLLIHFDQVLVCRNDDFVGDKGEIYRYLRLESLSSLLLSRLLESTPLVGFI